MRAIALIGPAGAGKTTLARALAGLEGGTESAFGEGLGLHAFRYLGEAWTAIDVPGGVEHVGQAARAAAAADAAVIVAPPEPEAAALVAPWLRLVKAAGAPAFLFVNRMDQFEGRVRDTVAALQVYASHALLLRQTPIRKDGHVTGAVDLISERAWRYRDGAPSVLVEIPSEARARESEARAQLLETLADYDDALLEQVLEDRAPAAADLFALMAEVHRKNALIPAHFGAASHLNGVTRLMKALRHEAPGPEATRARLGGARAAALEAESRRHLGKVVLLRDFAGGLAQGEGLGGGALGALLGLDGRPFAGAPAPGGFAVAARADHLAPATLLDAAAARPLPCPARPPALRRVLTPADGKDDAKLSAALARLAAADPDLAVGHDPDSGAATVATAGPLRLKSLLERLEAEFGVKASAAAAPPRRRETVTRAVEARHRHKKQTGGAGQFAEVSLVVRPLARGEGFRFRDEVKGGAVPRNYIPAVAAGAEEACAKGPLGFPVVDLEAVLTDGKAHAVDSSDLAFRIAGAACLREALKEARPAPLHPVDRVTIHTPALWSGSLLGLVSALKGQVLGYDPNPEAPGWDLFRALVPEPALEDLRQQLGGLTQGVAWIEAEFDHYEETTGREAERAIAAAAG